MKDLDIADSLMNEGRYQEALEIVRKVVSEHPTEEGICSDAVSVLMVGRLYNEALTILDDFQTQTGRKLRSDFSRAEIERERQRTGGSDGLNFKRLSVRQRGHFSNLPTFRPVRELVLSSSGVKIVRGWSSFFFDWKEIGDAVVVSRKASKSYGRASAKYVQRTFCLTTPKGIFKFDVSKSFPDFEPPDRVIEAFQQFVGVRTEKR